MMRSSISLITFALLVTLLTTTQTSAQSCSPVDSSSLTKWSSLFGLSSKSTPVTIGSGQSVLLDVSGLSVGGIIIHSGGKLYFDWTQSITLNTAFIQVQGELWIGSESCPYQQQATLKFFGNSESTVDNMNAGVRALVVGNGGRLELHGAKGLKRSWMRLAKTAQSGATTLSLSNSVADSPSDPSGWKAGDTIALASTDFSPLQSETATIASVVDARTITLSAPLKFMHYGGVTNGVDESGEVGLLSRNILIQAAQDDGIGAHIMMLAGSTAHIEGIESTLSGQDMIGRYPIHWHLAGKVPGSYAKDNSVHHTYFRCITIHGSHNVLVDSNVAYDSTGHCYYIEDGVEENNVLNNNLGMLTRSKNSGQRIGSDSDSGVSTFWITNPANTFTNNVAAGSYHTGYWFNFRTGPAGLSASNPQYANVNPSQTPFIKFSGNKAVACDHGFNLEATDFDAGDNPPKNNPPTAAYDPKSGGVVVQTDFTNLLAHHCRFRGFWGRGVKFNIGNCIFADNYQGIELGTSGDHPLPGFHQVHDTLFVGFTDNKGSSTIDNYQLYSASAGRSGPRNGTPQTGMSIYDGPDVVQRCTFTNYYTIDNTPHSAIGTRYYGEFQIASSNQVQSCVFNNVMNKVHVSDRIGDGGKVYNFQDDGSVTGKKATVLTPWDFYTTPNCKSDSSYGLACPHRYGQLWAIDMSSSGPVTNDLTITRADHTDSNHRDYQLQFNGFFSSGKWRYQPAVSFGATYLLNFQSFVPNQLALQLNNAQQSDAVKLAICYPAGSTITSVQRGYSNGLSDTSLLPSTAKTNAALSTAASMGNSSGESYYFDSSRNILFLTLQQRQTHQDQGNFCPSEGCDFVWVNANIPAGAAAVDCTNAAFSGSNSIQVSSGSWLSTSF